MRFSAQRIADNLIVTTRHILVQIVAIFICVQVAFSQVVLVPRDNAKSCGCTDVQISPHWAPAGGPGKGPTFPESGVYGTVFWSQRASNDLPLDHEEHDVNFFVDLDEGPQSHDLNSDGNYNRNAWYLPSLTTGHRLMEMEWDGRYFPREYWPVAGDRVWVYGRYVWDCGHPDSYHTEVHPPNAIAIIREEPVLWPGAAKHSRGVRCLIYVTGRGGKYVPSGPGTFADLDGIANREYHFSIKLPAGAPAGTAHHDPIVRALMGGAEPKVTWNGNSFDVVYKPISSGLQMLADQSGLGPYAAEITVGWNPYPGPTFSKATVTFSDIEIADNLDRFCEGDWHMWIQVNGEWKDVPGLRTANDGDDITIDRKVDVVVEDGKYLVIQTTGWKNNMDFLMGRQLSVAELEHAGEDVHQNKNGSDLEQNPWLELVRDRYLMPSTTSEGAHPGESRAYAGDPEKNSSEQITNGYKLNYTVSVSPVP
jgi:hypothetical protein